jgi:hypothetical protein
MPQPCDDAVSFAVTCATFSVFGAEFEERHSDRCVV